MNPDLIVVGGGPAGSTTATYMAMKGHRVVLFERDVFPRYRLGESLLPSTMTVLQDLDLVAAMEEAGFPKKTGGSFTWGKDSKPWSVLFSENPFLPSSYGYHVERSVFDKILLDRAIEEGVEVRQPCSVVGPLKEDGRVVGVRFRDKDGSLKEQRARFVLDASGPACVIGKDVTVRTYDDRMRQTAVFTYYKNIRGCDPDMEGHVVVSTCPKGWFWYIPMKSQELGEASVGLVTGQEFRPELKKMGAAGFFEEALSGCPEMQKILGPDAERIGDYRGIKDWAFASDRMAGPGFFLAGDAAAFVDPLLSTGVTLAMLAGYSASVCMHSILENPEMEGAAIRFYDRNYKRMYSVTRDCLLYFYSCNDLAKEDIFWKSRRIMHFDDNIGAKQAFSFLVNTVGGNPHPAAIRQIHMFTQFMAHLDHPLEAMTQELGGTRSNSPPSAPDSLETLNPKTVPRINGKLEQSCVIDEESHTLQQVKGIHFDMEKPIFSSTVSWLLGKNFTPMDEPELLLLSHIDGRRTWSQVLEEVADTLGTSPETAEADMVPILERLCDDKYIVLEAH